MSPRGYLRWARLKVGIRSARSCKKVCEGLLQGRLSVQCS